MQKLILIVGLLFLFVRPVLAGGMLDPCHYSTEGTDFWFGIMQNRSTYSDHYLEITVSSRLGADFTVSYGSTEIALGGVNTVGPNSSLTVRLDYNLIEPVGSEKIEDKGIHLHSTNPVNVYALNYRTQSSDVAVIYPTEALGKEYFAMCYTPNPTGSRETNSEFMIVATEDNTNVKIKPSVNTTGGNLAGLSYSVSLNKGQSYQVQSMNTSIAGQGDLTGSYINSNKPIAFFSGSKATSIPFTGSSYDYLYEQIPPTITWGKEFYVVPLKLRSKDTYRILAAENGTSIQIDGLGSMFVLNRGEYREFELNSNQASRIIASKKIIVAQYCRSQGADGTGGVGDPFMIIISPVSQKINEVTFVAYESSKIKNIFYVNIIANTSEVGNMELDGANIGIRFTAFPNNEYSYAQIQISKGTHTLRNTNSKGGFLAFVYGFGDNGDTESYGYGVGFNLDIQLEIVGNWTSFIPVVCQGKEIKLSVENNFDSYQWNTSPADTLYYINVSKEGTYKITGTTSRGCNKSDSLFLKVSDPKMYLGNDTSSCGPGKITLKATNGFKSYQWQDGSTNQTIAANNTGDYVVTGTNEYGCEASDMAHVNVYDVPEVKITGEALNCGIFNAELKVEVSNADASVWNYPGAAKWTSSPAGLTLLNKQATGVSLAATKPGLYTVNYVLTTLNGCQDSASFQVGFYEIPESTFDVYSPSSTDPCSTYERIVKYTGKSDPSKAKFHWDFGGLILLDHPSPDIFKISIGANQTNRTISLYIESNGCTSPVTSKSIGVTPTFTYGADKVHGCDSMCVQFNSKILIADKVSYEWTFGDGAVSTLQNPQHCYKDTGKYDVSLMITNVIDGCKNGSIEKDMIQIFKTPKAAISADPTFCYSDTARFEYLNEQPISKCKWFVKGNELISTANTKATYLLKNEISEVGFTVEENGCTCDTLKVLVKRKPNFDFLASDTELCSPFSTTLKRIVIDPNLEYTWTVDTITNFTGDSIVHQFNHDGYYSVKLEAFSKLTGCSDVLIKDKFIHIYPLPIPKFDQNYKVATLEHPDIIFANQSQKAVKYFWNFGDGTTSEDKDPKHTYADIGEYKVIMQAFSDFGCTDTISSMVKIIPFSFFVPNAFRPDSDIPENRIFLPIREGIDPEKYKFEIFNRIGSTVFDAQNPENGWNGTMPNGSKAEPGIYVWIVRYADIQGFDHQQKGTVMLVR